MNFNKEYKVTNLHKVLTLAVVLMNTANIVTPLAASYTAMDQAALIDYKQVATVGDNVIQQSAQILDNLIFSKAEAYTQYVGGGNGIDSVDGETITTGGQQNIDLGGLATNTIIDGGVQRVNLGGQTINTTINSGHQDIRLGGVATGTTINNDGEQAIDETGQATNTIVNDNGLQYILQNGQATDTVLNNRGEQSVHNNGQAINTVINDLGRQLILDHGQVTGTTINDSGQQLINNNGQATNTTINVNGQQLINNDGQATGTTINDSGEQHISDNGKATNTNINGNGKQYIGGNGQGIDTIINNGGYQQVSNNAQATGTIVNDDGTQAVLGNGQVTNTTINNNGLQQISDNAQATGTIVNDNGEQNVFGNGQVTNTTINNNGWQHISNSAQATGTIVDDNGTQNVFGNGRVTNTTLNKSGRQFIFDNGQAIDTILNNNASQRIDNNAEAIGTIINDNGVQGVLGNGQVTNTTINNNGWQQIADNAQAVGTIVNNNGLQHIYNNAQAIGTIINGGGQHIYSGALATDTTINQGGASIAYAGGMYAGQTINDGLLDLSQYDQTSGLNLSGTIGTVNIMNPNQITFNRNVTINELSGSQTFVISSDLANNKADMITITDSAAGNHYIQIGKENTHGSSFTDITDANRAQVVATPGGGAIFEGALSAIDGVMIMPNIVQDGDYWYLTGYTKKGESPLADTAFSMGNMAYAALLNSISEIMIQRMGEIQDGSRSAGVWSKIGGGQKSLSGDRMSHHSIQIGYDKVLTRGRGQTLTGVMVEHLSASTSYQNASGKLRNTQLGLYHIWQGQSGHYYDLVLKTGSLHNEFGTYEHEKITGAYNTWATSISAEYGYKKQLSKGYYVMPMAKLSLGRINGANYITSGDTGIEQDAISSLTAKLGVSIGRKVNNTSWYLNTAVMKEFTATDKVRTGLGEFQSVLERNLKSTYLELTLGGNVNIGKQGLLYMDINKTFGGKVQNKWKMQAGYRFSF